MVSTEQLATWILEELARLGCQEISLDVETGSSSGLLRRGDEVIRIGLEPARRALFVVRTCAGDEAAWEALRGAAEDGGRC